MSRPHAFSPVPYFCVPERTLPEDLRHSGAEEIISGEKPDWCSGCGCFGILSSIQEVISSLGVSPKDVLIVSEGPCFGWLCRLTRCYGFQGYEGAALNVAIGAKLANPDLTVIAAAESPECFGPGLADLMLAARRNIDMTYIVLNDCSLGRTKESFPPTWPGSTALASGAAFVARVFSGEPKTMAEIFAGAVQYRGFSFVDCLSPCEGPPKAPIEPGAEGAGAQSWESLGKRVYKLDNERSNIGEMAQAQAIAAEWETQIPVGLFYEASPHPTWEEEEATIRQFGPPLKRAVGFPPGIR